MTVAIRTALVAMLVGVACSDDDAGMDASTGDDASSSDAIGSSGVAPPTSGPTSSPTTGGGSGTGMADDAGSGSTSAAVVDYAGEIQPIWDAACTCHVQGPSGMMTATTLTLNADVSHAELVGTTATQAAMPRVAPGDPGGSYLWHKLQGTQMDVGGMGTAMPQIGELTEDELALIEAWIAGGAPP
jgi:hypothetical protein